jgi:2-polyprenyl-6-methoxyphenol hydroxylase-like FAD-dependent oxidoreductase
MRGSNTQHTETGGHCRRALVIGGSMAGLTAARVLAKYFDKVVIVERDQLSEGPEPRKGVPQARHVHALLSRGRQILESLFPGFENQLFASGAVNLDAGRDIAWLSRLGWGPRFASNVPLLACTRDLMDWALRAQLKEMNSVSFLGDCDVVGLVADASRRRVAGVQIRLRTVSARGLGQTKEVSADLVVDASGRSSQAPRWLEELGYCRPKKVIVNAGHGYSSRLYRMFPDSKRDWRALYVQPAPPRDVRGGLIFPVEGERWLVSLWGGSKDYPANDEAGFLDFARSPSHAATI